MKGRKWRYLAAGVLFAVCAACAGVALFWPEEYVPAEEQRIREEIMTQAVARENTGQPAQTPEGPEEAEPFSVDFEALQTVNSDIYAWLYVPGTEINFPVLQREGNGAFYLKHNSAGLWDPNGAIFTESEYNAKDFADPVTILYGHQMRSGKMFGTLQSIFSQPGALEEYSEIIICLPEQELHYTVFAAVPYDRVHILHYNDFSDGQTMQEFIDKIYSSRGTDVNLASDTQVGPEDQLLILSTCLSGNSQRRYLVLAKRI